MPCSAINPNTSLIDMSEEALVKRARQGDGAAFELIVRRHNQALFRAARGVLDDEGRAQEAVQEAYLNAFTHLDSYRGRASLKTWLTRIAVNQALSIKRRQRPVVSLDEKVAFLHSKQSEEGGMASYIADKDTPEMAVNRQEMKHLLETAIRRLPEIYRSVFMLRAVEGMSVADSAFCLDINEALVKKRLSRARKLLRLDLSQLLEVQASEVFEFGGKHCDAVTSHVMSELVRREMIKPG